MGHLAALPRNSAALGAEGREGWAHPREVGRPFRTKQTPMHAAAVANAGILRLRSCFAPRSGYSAQDDRFIWLRFAQKARDVGHPERSGGLREILSFTRRWNPTLTSKGTTLGWGTRPPFHETLLRLGRRGGMGASTGGGASFQDKANAHSRSGGGKCRGPSTA
jgi:hypothetical protein